MPTGLGQAPELLFCQLDQSVSTKHRGRIFVIRLSPVIWRMTMARDPIKMFMCDLNWTYFYSEDELDE
jgi:hypothetical protein